MSLICSIFLLLSILPLLIGNWYYFLYVIDKVVFSTPQVIDHKSPYCYIYKSQTATKCFVSKSHKIIITFFGIRWFCSTFPFKCGCFSLPQHQKTKGDGWLKTLVTVLFPKMLLPGSQYFTNKHISYCFDDPLCVVFYINRLFAITN